MSNETLKRDSLRDLMKESLLEMPFSDFESRTMRFILIEAGSRASAAKDKKLSSIFFVLGNVSGLLIALLLLNTNVAVEGLSPYLIRLFCQGSIALLTILLCNSLLNKMNKHKIYD
ncbi:MAG TPA: hypothetical protein VGD22_05635 [Sphingobacteriaceae bacterium]